MGYERKEQLARSIALALTTGLFSIVPVVAEGAPVVDKVVTPETSVQQKGKVTDVTSTVKNNIVNWKDFSVAKDETVRFDQGAQTNNYLNVVTGSNQSEIAGKVEGGKNVYIVNQHGVLIDQGATINVGNLYVSTTKPENLDTKAYLATGASPLVNTANAAAADVTNLGKIQATNVAIEGNNVKFMNTADVSAESVKIDANGKIRLGHRMQQPSVAVNGIRRAPAADSTANYTLNHTADGFTAIYSVSELQGINTNNLAGSYELAQDIDCGGAFIPIGGNNYGAFTGRFDGNYHTVSNLTVSGVDYGGLFGQTSGNATIQNVGVSGGSIFANVAAGGIVGQATNTTLTNVFNNGTSVGINSGTSYSVGGIVGSIAGSTLDKAYNLGSITKGRGGGIAGTVSTSDISNVYNKAYNVKFGIWGTHDKTDASTLKNAYSTTISTKAQLAYSQGPGNPVNVFMNASSTHAADYNHDGDFGISDSGDSDSVWRIYEGYSTPLLRDLLRRGKGTVSVKYSYDHGTDKGTIDTSTDANHQFVYNAQDLNITPVSYQYEDGTEVTSGIKTVSLTQPLHDANVYTNDTDAAGTTASKNGDLYFYCEDQNGYDLVGDKIFIKQRTVDINNALTNGTVTKTYDGDNTVTEDDMKSLLTGLSAEGTGLIADDTTASFALSNLNAHFNSKNVGAYDESNPTADTSRYVVVESGGISLVNAAGHHNYTVSGSGASLPSTLKGQIDKASLTVAMATGKTLTREYNGKNNSALKDSDRAKAGTLDSLFSLTGVLDSTKDGATTSSTDDVKLAVVGGESGDYGTLKDGVFTKTGKAGDHDVAYTGIYITGDDAGNYKLVDSSGNDIYQTVTNGVGEYIGRTGADDSTITGGTFYTTGTITRKTIHSDSFQLPDGTVSKTYDGDAYLDAAKGQTLTSDDIVSGDTVHFTVGDDGKSAWFSDADGNEKSDAGSGYRISYKVTVDDNDTNGTSTGDADNYIFSSHGQETNLTNGATPTVTSKSTGTIDKRVINLALGTPTAGIDKDYDGDALVKKNEDGSIKLADALVTYADGSTEEYTSDAKNVTDKLIASDKNDVAFSIKGYYLDENGDPDANVLDANRDGVGEAKKIKYIALLTGDKAKNYAFGSTGNNSETTGQTITGATGTINPKELTASIDSVSKTFDWSAKTGQQTTDTLTADNIKLNGLVSDADKSGTNGVLTQSVIDALNANGTYGLKKDGTFTADEHAGSKVVQYTGLKSGSTNYKIKNSTVETTGTIGKLTIDNVVMKTGDVSKVYDGKSNVATAADGQNAAKTAQSYITSVQTLGKDNQYHDLAYTVADDGGAYYIDASGAKTRNVSDATKARFLLKIDESGDFTVGDSLKTGDYVQRDTDAGKASITPRTVYASVTHTTPFTKTYDATTDAGLAAGDDAVTITGLLTDLDGATNQSTGAFKDKNVAYTDGTDLITTKDVDYTIKLDSAAAQANYAVYKTGTTTKLAYDTAGELTGKGKITPADLTPTFAAVTKTYDGNRDVGKKANTTGFSAGLDGVLSVTTTTADGQTTTTKDDVGIEASMDDALFDTPDKGTGKTVTYQYKLTGNDVRNYHLTTEPTVDGQNATKAGVPYRMTTDNNTIETKHLTKDDIAVLWGDVQKTYDGGKNVAYDHTGKDGVTYFDEDDVVAGTDKDGNATSTKVASRSAKDFVNGITFGNIAIQYGIKDENASYDTAAAGTGKTVTYKFDLTKNVLDNYDVTDSSLNGILSLNSDGSGILTETTTGTITPKYFKMDFTPIADHSQVYNGAATLVKNSQDDVTGAANAAEMATKLANTVSNITGLADKADASGLVTVTGTFIDSTVDGKTIAAKDAGVGKTIQYDVALKNTNYQFFPKGTDSTTTTQGTMSTDGKTMTYTGTGTIEQKRLTVDTAQGLFDRVYNGETAVEQDDLKQVTFKGLVGSETLTPGLATDTTEGLAGDYALDDGTLNGDVAWDDKTAEKAKGVKLTGIKAALANATGTADVANYKVDDDEQLFTAADNRGIIRRLAITKDDVEHTWKDNYHRDYDGTSTAATDANDVLTLTISHSTANGKTVNLPSPVKMRFTGSSDFYDSTNQKTVSDAGTGYDLRVTIDSIKEEDLHNFSMEGLTKEFQKGTYLYSSEKNTAGNAYITPRLLIMHSDGTNFDKEYDGRIAGKNDVVENGKEHFTVVHATKNDDGTYTYDAPIIQQDQSTVSAAIEDKGVYYNVKNADGTLTHSADADDNTPKTISATLTITGDTKGNYTIARDAKDTNNTQYVNHSGEVATDATGTISRKEIWLDVPDSVRFDKEYDGSSSVLADPLKNFTFDGLVDGETLTPDYAKLSGNYVTGAADNADDAAKEDKQSDVNWQNNAVQDWGILISGGEDALSNATSSDSSAISSNYKISDTVYFQQALGRGKIKPIALTMDNLKKNWTPVSKTYDGTTAIKDASGNVMDNAALKKLLTFTVDHYNANGQTYTNAQDVGVAYTLDNGVYDNKDVGQKHVLNYTITSFDGLANADGTANHNFYFQDSYKNIAAASDANNVITPKKLSVTLDGTTKTYDGTKAFTGSYTFDDGAGIEDIDKDTVKVAVVDGYYDSKNADKADGVDKRTITYGVELTGNDAGNYTLDTATHAEKGDVTETKAGLTADGHIDQRTVYVDFANGVTKDSDGNATGIDKTYGTTYQKTVTGDGYEAAKREADETKVAVRDRVDTATEQTGIVDDDVALDYSKVNAQYEDGNVHRDSKGNATTQAVLFDNFQLKDTDTTDGDETGNYIVEVYGGKQQLAGTGTISPATVHVTVDNTTAAQDVSKEYDAETTLTDKNLAAVKANATADAANMMLGEGVNDLGLTVTGSYAGAHANRTDGLADGQKGVNYTLNWTNKNYDLDVAAKDATNADHAMTTATVTNPTDSSDGTATTTVAQGTITPRTIAITGARDTTKTYDGTSAVTDMDAYGNLTFDRLLDADKTANTFATSTGTYYDADNNAEDANAGVEGDTDASSKALRDHKVRYTDVDVVNTDYELSDPNYTAAGYVLGNGTITRASLTFASNSVQGRYGQTPTFTGSVSGWQTTADKDAFQSSDVKWDLAPGVSTRGTTGVPIYGWYRDSSAAGGYRNSGNYGLNYYIVQQPGTYTAQADGPDISELNPAKRFRPDMDAYNHASHDDIGTAIRDPKAGIEYQSGGTSLSTDGSSAYNGTMKVEGAGDIVNLGGSTASADRVDLTDEEASYTVAGAENVPTADVEVADLGSAEVVTDDDRDVLTAAMETKDHEAEASIETTDDDVALFDDAIA